MIHKTLSLSATLLELSDKFDDIKNNWLLHETKPRSFSWRKPTATEPCYLTYIICTPKHYTEFCLGNTAKVLKCLHTFSEHDLKGYDNNCLPDCPKQVDFMVWQEIITTWSVLNNFMQRVRWSWYAIILCQMTTNWESGQNQMSSCWEGWWYTVHITLCYGWRQTIDNKTRTQNTDKVTSVSFLLLIYINNWCSFFFLR